jgi:hypothetical protein
MGSCIDCGKKDESQFGAYRCSLCIRQAENRKWEAEQQGYENSRIQNELLSIEQQRLFEQRQFQQKILEQSISPQKAFEVGFNRQFENGDIQFGKTGFEFLFSSPYMGDDLSKAFFEGVNSKFSQLFTSLDWDNIYYQIAWVGDDFRNHIEEKSGILIANAIANALSSMHTVGGFMRTDCNKSYSIMASASDGQSYCIHLLTINSKIEFDRECNLIISGINETPFPGSRLNSEFSDSLKLKETTTKINNPEKIGQIKKNDVLIIKKNTMKTFPLGAILQIGVFAFAIFYVIKIYIL